MKIRIIPLPDPIAAEARATMQAPGYGHPIYKDLARGYGPCRSCLSTLNVGSDERLLMTYDPFMELERLPLPGPIYIHAAACERYDEENTYPNQLRFIPTTLNAYGRGRQLREVRYVGTDGAAEPDIEALLHRSDVDYIHVRNTEAGCYMFRVERG